METPKDYADRTVKARKLANYIQTIYSHADITSAKFWACMPSIILDFESNRPVQELIKEIEEHG